MTALCLHPAARCRYTRLADAVQKAVSGCRPLWGLVWVRHQALYKVVVGARIREDTLVVM